MLGVKHTRRLNVAQLDTMRFAIWTAYDEAWNGWTRVMMKLREEVAERAQVRDK